MKKVKRILATFLIVLMLVTSTPLSGFADFDLASLFTIKAEAANTDYKVGDHIQYGNYPQSRVTNSTTLALLNATNTSWVSYKYYSGTGDKHDGKMRSSDYMQYRDVSIGGTKYRAVKFSKYRNYYTGYTSSVSYGCQLDNGYYTDTIYWFKFEPLNWRILDPNTGLIICDNIIDSQAYQNIVYKLGGEDYISYYKSEWSVNGYANEYERSSIRYWLNDTFYDTAFNSDQKLNIDTSTVEHENKGKDYGFTIVRNTITYDKIFLLSKTEVTNPRYGFNSNASSADSAKIAKGTDYSRAQGLNLYQSDNSAWWLRTEDTYNLNSYVVNYDGRTDYVADVTSTYIGVRPACRLINLKSNITQTTDNSKYTTGDVNSTALNITPRMKNTTVDGSVANVSSLKDGYYAVVKNATAKVGSKHYSVSNDSLVIPYNEGKSGITISADKYNDYIIPGEVAESFIYRTGFSGNYEETIYMRRDKENGKPYVSSVYAKTKDYDEAYSNLVDGSTYTLNRDTNYDIIVSAENVKGNATYYIAQDNNPNHTLSNDTGIFSAASFAKFDKSKTIYVWVVGSSNGGSEQISLKTKITDIEDNALYKSLKNGKYSLGGKDGIQITFPKDWVLIGGTSLDMSAFSFPAKVTYDPVQGTVRVAVGLAKYNATADPTKDEKTWSFFKDSMKGISKEAEKWEKGKYNYNVLKLLKKAGISTRDFQEYAKEKKFEVGGNMIFAAEFTVSGGELVLKEGYGAIEAKVKASMDGQYLAVVYGISGGADGSFGLTASRQVCSNDAPLSLNLKLSLTPNLKVYAGVGVQHVASADAYGVLKLPFNWSLTQSQIDIALSGEVGLEAKLFVFKKNVVLLDGTLGPKYFYYGNELKSPARSPLLPQVTVGNNEYIPTYELQSRDYAENTSQWLGETKSPSNGPNKIKASSTTANGVTFKNLQTSVYDNSNAKVITCGNTTLATWIEDDANRDAYNRTRLVYSIYNASNDTWSAPKAVCDDGYMDANPYLATDGSDIYVAWQKLCKNFNVANSMTDNSILDAGEIYLAKYDKNSDGFVDSKRLTNNEVYDYNPVVTIEDGKPVVYYCTSSENSMSEANGNTIFKYSNETTVTVKDNLSTIYALDVCGDEIAYAVDTDGDTTTTEDIRTFYGSTSFVQFDEETVNSEMNFAFGKLDGKDTLFVSDGNNIYYNDNGEVKAVLEENCEIHGQINVVNTRTGLSIFWTQENEKGNEIFTCSYANGKWSGATQSTSRNNEFSNISITTASNGKIIGMCNETARELDETESYYVDGISNLVTFTANDYTDLTSVFVDVDEKELVPGQTTKIFATVENNGNIEAENFVFTVTDDYGTESIVTITEPLESGKEETYELDYVVPENFNGGDITVTVDADGDVDSKDNSVAYSVDTPDLTILLNSISNDGSLYTINTVVNNNKFTTAKNVTFKSYFGEIEDEPFDKIQIGDVSRDAFKNVQFAFTENDIVTDENGTRFVYLVVEDEDGNDSQIVINLNENDTVCGHPVTEERAETPATCTENGNKAGIFCTACESYIDGGEEIPATGHTEKTVQSVVATCISEGYTGDIICADCGEIIETGTAIAIIDHIDEDHDRICDVCGGSMCDILPGGGKVDVSYDYVDAHQSPKRLRFIPDVSGLYTMSLEDNIICSIALFYENNDEIISQPGSRLTYHLEKDKTYFFVCEGDDGLRANAELSFDEEHSTTTVPEKEATCAESGYTEGIYCENCKKWVYGHKSVVVPHTDANSDEICDVCGDFISDIQAGEIKKFNINTNEITYIKFIPSKSGRYTFTSHSNDDTYGYLYDADKNQIASNDDSGEGGNFKITYFLEKGKTYYFGCRYYNTERNGSFDVELLFEGLIDVKLEETEVFDVRSGDMVTFTFTPENNGIYYVFVNDLVCKDKDGSVISLETYYGYEEVDEGWPLKSGEVYTFEWRNPYDYSTDLHITMHKSTYFCPHIDISEAVESSPIDCATPGYTSGKYCNDCEKWLEGHEEITISHTDENYDRLCDICGGSMCDIMPSGGKVDVSYDYESQPKKLRFIPIVSGLYTISVDTSWYYNITIYDEDNKRIADSDCKSLTYHLEKDKTYFFVCQGEDSLRANAELSFDEEHNTTFMHAKEATCAESGYTEGIYCEDCQKWVYGHKSVVVPHTDANSDEICDVCGNSLSDIKLGETKTIEIISNEITYLKYIPTASGRYTFTSHSSDDTYGYLFDENKEEIARNDDYDDANFKVTSALEAGKTYYWGARYYDMSRSGSFDVELICDEIFCEHKNTENIPAREMTCTEDGITAGVYCNDCEKWIRGHEIIKAHHTDENADRICDVCGNEAVDYQGFCNDEQTASYKLYSTGELEISGTGVVNAVWGFDFNLVKKITVEEGITELGFDAFHYFENVSEVSLPSTLEVIGGYAFALCGSLKSIELPENLKIMGEDAFAACGLESVEIPEGIEIVDYWVFSDCSNLKTVKLPSTLKTIGTGAFIGCERLEDITIPDGVETIGDYSFRNCLSLEGFVIPEGVTSINAKTFENCISLTSITIPNSVTSIGESAFKHCSSLTSVTIPENVTSIEYGAFGECSSLTSITIPNSVTSIGESAFKHCSSLTSITIPENVTSIEYGAFEECSSLTNITIPDNVTSIGSYAFAYCSSLENVTISDNVTSVGYNAFYRTPFLNNTEVLYVGKSLLKVSTSFSGEFNVKDGTEIICDSAFIGCDGLTKISIPNGVKSIGSNAFEGCRNLSEIYLPDTIEEIGNDAFYNTAYYNNDDNWDGNVLYLGKAVISSKEADMDSLSIKDGTEIIADFAFGSLDAFPKFSSFSKVNIPDSVKVIGGGAFYFCNNLKQVSIPNSVTAIGGAAFGNCSSLTEITIPESITSISDSMFEYCESLENITIPNSVKSIEDEAFSYCSSLISIIIPGSVTNIGEKAFYRCENLTNISILESVSKIGKSAFGWCDQFKNITILNPDCEICPGDYEGDWYATIPSYVTIHGYANSTAQKYAEKYYIEFVAIDSDHTPGDVNGDGAVTMLDTVLISRYIVDGCSTDQNGYAIELNEKAADVNGDGEITMLDVVMLSRFIVDGCKSDPDGYNITLK